MPTDLPKLAAPAQRALASIGVTRLEQLQSHSQNEILALHGMGKNAMATLIHAMNEAGLDFANP